MNNRPADRLAICCAQLNPTVGDIAGNAAKVRRARDAAAAQGADLVVFPELFITGYPPEDLVLKPAFQAACRAAIEALARETAAGGPALLVGTPWVEDGKLYNAVALLDGGKIAALRFKVDLPNYGVFDEKRVFAAGPMPGPVNFRGVRLGVPICEDIWGAGRRRVPGRDRRRDPARAERLAVLAAEGRRAAQHRGGARHRAGPAARSTSTRSAARTSWSSTAPRSRCNADCSLAFQLPAFEEAVVTTHWVRRDGGWRCENGPMAHGDRSASTPTTPPACWACATTSTRTAFPGVVLGLSGGIDSALVAAMAVDALGADARPLRHAAVHATPSQESLDDAAPCAKALGVALRDRCRSRRRCDGLEAALAPAFAGTPRDVTEENLQSRARGTILMAISNKFNLMVVTTGNKSEMSVGYATLYGDMNGGFNPIKDLYKTRGVPAVAAAQRVEAGRRARARRRRHSGEHHHAAADGGVAREPDGRGFAAALQHARSDPRAAGRARGADLGRSSPPASSATRWCGSSACSTSPNTSGGRRRRA